MSINPKLIPPSNSLLMFEAAARLGSVTQAANELCVTPTAVSKQIKKLESFLNTELLIRSTQGVTPTGAGRHYLERVTEALQILADETIKLDESLNPPALNIEVGPCFLHYWLLPRLDLFREAHPEILFNLNVNNERIVRTHHDYDVAFFYSQVDSLNRHNHLLFHERVMLVCSPGFLEKRGGHIDISTVFDQPLIMLKDELPFWEGWQSWAEKVDIAYRVPHDALLVEDQVAVIQATINDAGIALAWDWHVRDLIKSGQLVALTEPVDFSDKAYFLSIAPECSSPDAQAFVNWVIEEERAYQRKAVEYSSDNTQFETHVAHEII